VSADKRHTIRNARENFRPFRSSTDRASPNSRRPYPSRQMMDAYPTVCMGGSWRATVGALAPMMGNLHLPAFLVFARAQAAARQTRFSRREANWRAASSSSASLSTRRHPPSSQASCSTRPGAPAASFCISLCPALKKGQKKFRPAPMTDARRRLRQP